MTKEELTKDILSELLIYENETGKLFWKVRKAHWFSENSKLSQDTLCRAWNTKYADKEAFTSLDSNGYFCGSVLGYHTTAHRIIFMILYGHWSHKVDHRNGKTTDNREINLVEATDEENSKNHKLRIDNYTGYPGISIHKPREKYREKFRVKIGNEHIGIFNTLEEAISIRKELEKERKYNENHGRK